MNRAYSLKKNIDIEKLVKSRISVGDKFYAIYYKKINSHQEIALSVSKKLGNAVQRNYEKRVIREIVRENIDKLEGYRVLIVAKKNSVQLNYLEKKEVINKLINLIGKEKK